MTVPPAAPGRWPWDAVVVAIGAAHLWAITGLWLALDLGGKLDGIKVSETDIWLLALSGALLAILAVLPIVAVWWPLLAGTTALLAGLLLLRRRGWPVRWGVSLGGAGLLALVASPLAIDLDEAPPPAISVADRDGLPGRAVIAAREQALAARCVDPEDPNIVAYCVQRREVMRMLDEIERDRRAFADPALWRDPRSARKGRE